MTSLPLTSIWCIPAAASRDVLILARYSDGALPWTHLLRWTPGRAPEPGAWALLRVSRRHSRIDPTGEFLQYHAADHFGGPWNSTQPRPFRASTGGAWAISRAPWLSALTDIGGPGYQGRGGGTSVHALPPKDQRTLMGLFPMLFGGWFERQQPGWARAGGPREVGFRETWMGQKADPRGRGVLMVVLPGNDQLPRFSWRDTRGTSHRMQGVAWADLQPDGGLLWATNDGHLRRGDRRRETAPSGWESEWAVIEDHDCSHRVPAPGPSPDWARCRR